MKSSGKYIKKLEKYLADSDNILLVCHVNPDGDAIGSMLALYHFLTSRGKNVKMLSPNYLQDFLLWMEGSESINIFLRNRKKARVIIESAQLIIFLDFNNASRLGESERYITKSTAKRIIIDHHVDPQLPADLTISEPSYCATAEIIYHLITLLNGGPYSAPAFNEAIYTGIITDTGNFVHGAFNGDTLRLVADLLDAGVEKGKVFDKVYNNYSFDRMRLQGLSLYSRMNLVNGYPAAYISLSADDMTRYNYSKGDTEGFVNMPLSIKGISVSALFVEKDGFIKVSLRSKGAFSVNDFAIRYFNGGGHDNASGGEFYDTLEKAVEHYCRSIAESMKQDATNNN